MKSPEAFEKRDVDKYLEANGYFIVKATTGGFGQSGHADRICCKKGRFVSLEVKRPGKEPTPIQWRRIREVEAAEGIAIWGTAKKIIEELEVYFPT